MFQLSWNQIGTSAWEIDRRNWTLVIIFSRRPHNCKTVVERTRTSANCKKWKMRVQSVQNYCFSSSISKSTMAYCVCVPSQCTFLPNSNLDQTGISAVIQCLWWYIEGVILFPGPDNLLVLKWNRAWRLCQQCWKRKGGYRVLSVKDIIS